MKEKYNVVISGTQLGIVTEETEEYITGLADQVDERVKAMIMSSKKCNKLEAALFCALDYLDEKTKTEETMTNLRKQIKSYEKDIEELKRENDELKKIIG
jgi:Cell division protein ZapA.